MVMLKWNHPPDSRVMENICTSFIEKPINSFGAMLHARIDFGGVGGNQQVRSDSAQMNEDMIKKRNQIIFLEHHSLQEVAYTLPAQDWEALLSGNDPTGFLVETRKYLQNLARNGIYNASVRVYSAWISCSWSIPI